MTRVLLSPVGTSDPMRSCHDGPLAHIVRHYRPEAVYLFLTAEMEELDRRDDRYSRSILAIHPACRIEKIYTGIQDAHNFDRFIGVFSEALSGIARDNPGSRILLNLTSGTPQMQLALALEAVLGQYGLTALQVSSPEQRSNLNNPPEGINFDLEEQLECNLDHQDASSPNRCRELPLLSLHLNNTKRSIRSLISRYEYAGALEHYGPCAGLLPAEAGLLLRHAAARSSLNLPDAKRLTEGTGLALFPVQEATPQRLTEYYMVMTIRQRQGQLSDFILKLTPFLFELTKYYLETELRFRLSSIASSGWLDMDKIMNGPEELKQAYINEFGLPLRKSEVSFTNLLPVLVYVAREKEQQNHPDAAAVRTNLQRLRHLRAYEKEIRNEVAHTISPIDESTFAATARRLHTKDASFASSMTSSRLLSDLRIVMLSILGTAGSRYQFVYDSLNSRINELLR